MIALLLAAGVSQSLPEVQQKLGEEREQAAKLQGREASLLTRLADLERQVEVEGRGLHAAQTRLRVSSSATRANCPSSPGRWFDF